MSIASGTHLGVYEVVSAIGAGGMGEVYRAQDTKLGRAVAIKVLPEAVAIDPERIGRFEREAKVLASLNHPNIAALFGMEQDGTRVFLIMELVEGDTLEDRISAAHASGGFRAADLLAIATQIAEGVEAAHEKGIVHRDLKPANIKISPDGRVKVLDFGLARAMAAEPTATGVGGLTHSPTLSMMATQAGMILGTAAYMSPEQAKGLQADHRSDVFSFGVVLYEMVTGRQPFHGETAPDVLASVLARDPDLSAIPLTTHARLRDLITRCLEKNPRRRWQAIGDVRAELEIIATAPVLPPPPVSAVPKRTWRRSAIPIAATALVVGVAAVASTLRLRSSPAAEVTRFVIRLPENQVLSGMARNAVALSPDGRHLAYTADRRIWLRALGDFDARPIAGPDTPESPQQAMQPVFSPDGQSIAYYAQEDDTIKRLALAGGAPITICNARNPLSVVWAGDVVLFTATPAQRDDGKAGIYRVPASGGTPERIVVASSDERMYGPMVLPDGEHLLFSIGAERDARQWEKPRVVVESMKTHERRTVIEQAADGRYLPTGHIVYAVNGVLLAIRFDVRTLSTVGGPTSVIEGVQRATGSASPAAQIAIASNGTLAYVPGSVANAADAATIAQFDFSGRGQPLNLPTRSYRAPRVSPDGKHVAYTTEDGNESAIWVADLAGRAAPRRLTFEGQGRNRYPIWSADGERVTFQSDREGDRGIFSQRADGNGAAERLTHAGKDEEHVPDSWHPGGSDLLYDRLTGTAAVLTLYSSKDKSSAMFGDVQSPVSTLPGAVFSPDGRWVAYSSRHGRANSAVYVQPFPATHARFQISKDSEDGHHPVWFRDGSRIAYTPGPGTTRMALVRVSVSGGSLSVSDGDPMARPFVNLAPNSVRPWDLTPDGQHVIGLIDQQSLSDGRRSASQIRVVLNWTEELKQRVPAR